MVQQESQGKKTRKQTGKSKKTVKDEIQEKVLVAQKDTRKKDVPPKIKRKQQRQEEREKAKLPPMCRYIIDISCIYHKVKIDDPVVKKDKTERPMIPFCRQICLPYVIGKYQFTNMFVLFQTISRQLSAIQRMIQEIFGRAPRGPPPVPIRQPSMSPPVKEPTQKELDDLVKNLADKKEKTPAKPETQESKSPPVKKPKKPVKKGTKKNVQSKRNVSRPETGKDS